MTSRSDRTEPWKHESAKACLSYLGDKAYAKQLGIEATRTFVDLTWSVECSLLEFVQCQSTVKSSVV